MKSYFAAVALLLSLSGCINYPTPCFQAPELVRVGDTVRFTNCTVDGYSYYWWFDDGATSTEANPKHVYTQRGKYKVYMTAYTKNGNYQQKANRIITVGNLFLDAITVINFPASDNGQPWDTDGSGPDVRITYGPAAQNGLTYTTLETPNLTVDTLPLQHIPFTDIQIDNEVWVFTILDIDGSTSVPIRSFTTPLFELGAGTHLLEGNGWQLQLTTSVR